MVPKYESWNCDGVLVLVKNGEARDDFLFPQVACRRYCGGCSMVNTKKPPALYPPPPPPAPRGRRMYQKTPCVKGTRKTPKMCPKPPGCFLLHFRGFLVQFGGICCSSLWFFFGTIRGFQVYIWGFLILCCIGLFALLQGSGV